jgi:hypothetical protein
MQVVHPVSNGSDLEAFGSGYQRTEVRRVAEALTRPERLYSRSEVLARPSPVPPKAGVYGWYFDEAPPGVITSRSVSSHGCHLLYVGISPKRPPMNGRPPSSQTLRSRISYHYRGNAEGSTLRLTLGSLLSERLGIQLRRVGSGSRYTFSSGEELLSAWMAGHAFVTWVPTDAPWLAEDHLIATLDLPLNLDQNARHPFQPSLKARRAQMRREAQRLPVLPR